MAGIIILCLTIAVLIGFAIYAIIWGPKPRIPNGERFDAVIGGKSSIVVINSKYESLKNKTTNKPDRWIIDGLIVSGQELADKCAKAIIATELAFKDKKIANASTDKVVFQFMDDDAFNKSDYLVTEAAAYSSTTGAMIGEGLPMVVIRERHMKTVSLTGQPAVHEMVHVLLKAAEKDYNSAHDDKRLWEKFGQDTVEVLGTKHWSDLNK